MHNSESAKKWEAKSSCSAIFSSSSVVIVLLDTGIYVERTIVHFTKKNAHRIYTCARPIFRLFTLKPSTFWSLPKYFTLVKNLCAAFVYAIFCFGYWKLETKWKKKKRCEQRMKGSARFVCAQCTFKQIARETCNSIYSF